jgi:hypothetical protein
MGQSTYYHNLTKNWFNENDYGDAVENSEVGDIIKMSFRGNALVIDLLKEDLEIESKGEHDWARKQFLDYFKEFHDVDFQNGLQRKDRRRFGDAYRPLSSRFNGVFFLFIPTINENPRNVLLGFGGLLSIPENKPPQNSPYSYSSPSKNPALPLQSFLFFVQNGYFVP